MADDRMADVGRDGRGIIRTDKHKGRGAKPEAEVEEEERYVGKSGMFDSLDEEPGAGPQRCELYKELPSHFPPVPCVLNTNIL